MPEVPLRPPAFDGPKGRGKPGSGRRGRRLGVEIKPGSVKQARAEAGLSLGQVARGDISRTAIYFVETGKSKPSMETLRLIAERTGRPIEFFLADAAGAQASAASAIAELERIIATGDNLGAVAFGEQVIDKKIDQETEAIVKAHMSMALLRLAQPVKARRLAASARRHFEAVGDSLMVAECLGHEASAAYLLQEPGALGIAEAALATLRTLKFVPAMAESRLLFVVAAANAVMQNWQAAIDFYQQAIDAGDEVRDLRRLSLTYSGISVAYQELGQFSQAARYSRQALAIHETLNDRVSLARSENNLGLLLARAGEFESSRTHLDRSLSLYDEVGVELGKSDAMLSLSELLLEQSDLDGAARMAREALALSSRLSEVPAMADAHLWLGRVAEARGRPEAADSEFVAAIANLEGIAAREPLRRIHAAYAEVLEGRGDLAGANRQLRQALAASGSTSFPAASSNSAIA